MVVSLILDGLPDYITRFLHPSVDTTATNTLNVEDGLILNGETMLIMELERKSFLTHPYRTSRNYKVHSSCETVSLLMRGVDSILLDRPTFKKEQ